MGQVQNLTPSLQNGLGGFTCICQAGGHWFSFRCSPDIKDCMYNY